MVDNVTSLEAKRREPDEDVVQELREWLELARRGELRGIALTGKVLHSGEAEHVFRQATCGQWDTLGKASALEQHAFSLRFELHGTTVDAPEVDVPQDSPEDEPNSQPNKDNPDD